MEGNNSFSLHNDANFDLELEQQCKKYLGETQWKYFRMQTKSLGNSYLFTSSYFPAREIDYSNISEWDFDFSLLLADYVYDLSNYKAFEDSIHFAGLKLSLGPSEIPRRNESFLRYGTTVEYDLEAKVFRISN